MSETTSGKTQKIWLMSAIAGSVAFLALLYAADYSTVASLIVGVLVALLVGILLWIGWFEDPEAQTQMDEREAAQKAAVTAASDATAAGIVSTTEVASDAPDDAEGPAEVVVAAPVAAPSAVLDMASVASSSSVAALSDETPEVPVKTKAPAKAPVAVDGKPPVLTQARDGGADNLKLLKGVGPKLEQALNALGFYHFDQVAGWRKKEIEWVDDNLKFKGRIERDGWVAQAKILAKGGETEFSKRSKK